MSTLVSLRNITKTYQRGPEKVQVLHGDAKTRRKRLAEDADIYVINHDGVGVVAKELAALIAAGEIDVLVCTAIIESGLDFPRANTLIVDNAQMFGLGQLYQLRGRVGRSSRRAWCYLLYRQEDALSEIARKRLKAIFDAAHLGAGFQLALADLEIRGAGDLLGGYYRIGMVDYAGGDIRGGNNS